MDEQPTMAELWALLQEQRAMMEVQRAEITSLKEALASQKRQETPGSNGDENTPLGIERRLSRAGLLKAAAAGVVGLAVAEAGSAGEAAASNVTQPTHAPGFVADYAGFATGFATSGNFYVGATFAGRSSGVVGTTFLNSGEGVTGQNRSGTGTAINGMSNYSRGGIENTQWGQGTGVWGQSGPGWGVKGSSWATKPGTGLGKGIGVLGESGTGVGVNGTAAQGTGVWAHSGAGHALVAEGGWSGGSSAYCYNTSGSGWGLVGRSYKGKEFVWGDGVGVQGDSGTGSGVVGTSLSGKGVEGTSDTGTGVFGHADNAGIGVRGTTAGVRHTRFGTIGGAGVQGESASGGFGVYGLDSDNNGYGVLGISFKDSALTTLGAGKGVVGKSGTGIGVWGVVGDGTAVEGMATTGRGGIFSGGAAQVQLVPSSRPNPPASGQTGDLFLDSAARLWLCRAGGAHAVWVTFGSGGSIGGSGPVVAHSGVIATPGVYGDNTTNAQSSIGVSGASVDGSGNPGNGTGVQGKSGTGTGVHGIATGSYGQGVLGEGPNGVVGRTNLAGYAAVYGGAGRDGYGLYGVTDGSNGVAVYGGGGAGRGARFAGSSAQLQLVPGSGSYPRSGQDGDLFLDSVKQLWLCTAGGNPATWQQLGATGGGPGGGPVHGISNNGTPGVSGDNTGSGAGVSGYGPIGVEGATNGGAWGVRGTSNSSGDFAAGVFGELILDQTPPLGAGVIGGSKDPNSPGPGNGVFGYSGSGIGVRGASFATPHGNTGNGSGTGVKGESGSGIAVQGIAQSGRGGVFSGGAAQLQLQPAAGNHPASGQDGDVFLDSARQLWLCTAGGDNATWQQLGTGGGGGGTDPVVAHSHAAGTPGVLGDNDSNDPTSSGITGKSLVAGRPGAGIGVLGQTGSGIGIQGATDTLLDASASIGVLGVAGQGTGVKGTSNLGAGVWGSSLGSRPGVYGTTSGGNEAGVKGVSFSDSQQLTRGSGTGVRGESGSGTGIVAFSESGRALYAAAGGNGAALEASNSAGGGGILAQSTTGGYGVRGISPQSTGVRGEGTTGVEASGTDVGLNATGANRGGVFSGGKAHLQLQPGGKRPFDGETGDVFFDQNQVLWICTLGGVQATWRQVQLV